MFTRGAVVVVVVVEEEEEEVAFADADVDEESASVCTDVLHLPRPQEGEEEEEEEEEEEGILEDELRADVVVVVAYEVDALLAAQTNAGLFVHARIFLNGDSIFLVFPFSVWCFAWLAVPLQKNTSQITISKNLSKQSSLLGNTQRA